jgi:excisionase family DNA binding protein
VAYKEGSDGMTPAQLAAELGVSRSTVYRWIRAERIKVGWYPSLRWRVPQDEVDRIRREFEGKAS